MACSNASLLTGLRKKPAAPARNAWRSSSSLARALRKTMGISRPISSKRRCNSKPSIPGMLTSSIRQPVSVTRPDCRKSSADAKASARRPELLRSLRVDLLTETSSSTTETSGASDVLFFASIAVPPPSFFMPHSNRAQHGNSTVSWYSTGHCPLGQVDADLALAGGSEFFNHPDQIGERFGAHFLHNVGAMKFDRSLGGGEFAGHLFIQQSGCNQSHHFALTGGELSITLAQFSDFRSLFARGSVPLDGGADRVQQIAAAEGLGKEFHGSRFHRAHRHQDVAMSSNENDRNVASRLSQLALKIHAAQSWH